MCKTCMRPMAARLVGIPNMGNTMVAIFSKTIATNEYKSTEQEGTIRLLALMKEQQQSCAPSSGNLVFAILDSISLLMRSAFHMSCRWSPRRRLADLRIKSWPEFANDSLLFAFRT